MADGYRYMSLRAHWHAVVNAAKRLPLLCWLMAVLAGLFLADAICLIVLFRRPIIHDTFEFEFAKALLQFVVVAVIGTLVSGVMFEYQRRSQNRDKEDKRERKKLIRREEFIRSILTRATEAYSNVKKTRRLLRARAIVWEEAGGKEARTKQYDLYLEMINDAQLELENLGRDIKTSEQTFSDPKALRTALSEMESYLGKLIKEYETAFERLQRPKSLALTALPQLEGFTATSTKGDFKKQFSDPFREIQRAIRKDLLPQNLPNIVSIPA